MYAVVATGGKQYRVSPNQKVLVEKLELPVGSQVELAQVLMLAKDDNLQVGTPLVEGAKVLAEVTRQLRGDKIHIIKFRRRKHYMRHLGHRQYYTELLIKEISG